MMIEEGEGECACVVFDGRARRDARVSQLGLGPAPGSTIQFLRKKKKNAGPAAVEGRAIGPTPSSMREILEVRPGR